MLRCPGLLSRSRSPAVQPLDCPAPTRSIIVFNRKPTWLSRGGAKISAKATFNAAESALLVAEIERDHASQRFDGTHAFVGGAHPRVLEEAHCKYVSSGGPDEELPEFLVAGLKTDHEAFFSALGDYTESESNLSEARVAADDAKFAVECAEWALARAKDEKKRRAVCVGPEPAAWAESWEERAPLRVFRMNTRPDSPPMWECVCDLSRIFWSHAEERQRA
jgi:hypothetical protein